MTREILFRAKRIDNDEWIQGAALMLEDGTCKIATSCIVDTEQDALLIATAYNVNPDTVSQYTGLTDQNGTKIFENDIVLVYGKAYTVEWQEEAARFVVSKDGAQFLFNSYWESDLEVIGNIFDNQTAEDGQNDTEE